MKKLILIPLILLFIGCVDDSGNEKNIQDITIATSSITTQKIIIKQRFKLEKVQSFRDDKSYTDYRDVFVLTDTDTNKTYVGISGVGISELGSHQEGKNSHEDER